jgi:hypothetical protein
MADTKHLLYILADVAYAVELVPDEETKGYAIRDYLQVNGEFMNENELLVESLQKLADKVQPHAYELVLPDFLFTNTVVNVDKTGEEEVKKHVLEELVPTLDITKEDYSIQAFMLTELKGSSKAQLSALELSVLNPLRETFNQAEGPSIKNVYPLSWTLKSLISLEPSISVVQMGSHLYLAQHYIGVDQASNAEVENADKLVETIKTLKGSEPSIQTLYLLSSALVEEKLKEGLKETVPLQQLADDSEESEMPSYVKQVVEAGAKTLSIADYKVPVFAMGAAKASSKKAAPASTKKENMPKTDEQSANDQSAATNLPTPTPAGGAADTNENKKETAKEELQFADVPEKTKPTSEEKTEESEADEEVDLSQFSSQAKEEEAEASDTEKESATAPSKPATAKESVMKENEPPQQPEKPAKKVIKNDTGVNSMVRMIFIGLVSFFVTVGIGLGIGLGLLTFTNQGGEPAETTPVAEVSPTAEPSPTPTPAPEIARSEHDVLVVNATTQAGYAGDVADDLEEAGFEGVAAANASGDYEPGRYVLLNEENQALVDLLSKDTGLELEYLTTGKEVEDSAEEYTIVIVLAE